MWFQQWFNDDYLKLYSHRTMREAEEQVQFIRQAVGLKGSESVLDLACGTGRHSLAFGTKGNRVVGIDLSKSLIDKAKQRLIEYKGLDITFLVADMFHLPDIGQFDLIVNLFTSFGYFEEDSQNQKVFEVVDRHLTKEGVFFLDYLHPYSVKQSLVPEENQLIEGERVVISRFLDKDTVIKRIEFPGRAYEERVKLYEKDKIEEMLENEGLTIVKSWNDYLGNEWKEEGDRQLFMCKKRAGERVTRRFSYR